MEGFLDNIAAVVTTDSDTMQQMVASLATLTATNTQQAATIAAQQKPLPPSQQATPKNRIRIRRALILDTRRETQDVAGCMDINSGKGTGVPHANPAILLVTRTRRQPQGPTPWVAAPTTKALMTDGVGPR